MKTLSTNELLKRLNNVDSITALEEYMDFLHEYPYDKPYHYRGNGLEAVVFWQEALKGEHTLVSLPEEYPCWISGNNVDGFIITEWRGMYGCQKELRRA